MLGCILKHGDHGFSSHVLRSFDGQLEPARAHPVGLVDLVFDLEVAALVIAYEVAAVEVDLKTAALALADNDDEVYFPRHP